MTVWYTYKRGRGMNGRGKWTPILAVTHALEDAFYSSFNNVTATNKRILIALDVCESMTECNDDAVVSPVDASMAMALVMWAVEEHVDIITFSKEVKLLEELQRDWKLDQALEYLNNVCSHSNSSDCAVPMRWARDEERDYDVFIVYTNYIGWKEDCPPSLMLQDYREEMDKPKARLAVVGMCHQEFAVVDPNDLFMKYVVGFDLETPMFLSNFISGVDE